MDASASAATASTASAASAAKDCNTRVMAHFGLDSLSNDDIVNYLETCIKDDDKYGEFINKLQQYNKDGLYADSKIKEFLQRLHFYCQGPKYLKQNQWIAPFFRLTFCELEGMRQHTFISRDFVADYCKYSCFK